MSKKLLLADDSVTIQKVIGISFANEDVTLVTVDNGIDAIAKTRELRPDLVLADVVMPGKTGYEVCEAIKSDPDLSHIPVLLLTGTFEAFDEERARQVGAAGHVAKPFEAQTLVNHVKHLLASAATPSMTALAVELDAPTVAQAESAEENFDFFSEDLAPVERLQPAHFAGTIDEPFDSALGGDPLLAGSGDFEIEDSLEIGAGVSRQYEAFSFGDDVFPDVGDEPIEGAASTVAILPDDAADSTFGAAGAPANPLATLTTELIEPDYAAIDDDLTSGDAHPIEPVVALPIEVDAATTVLDDGFEALGSDESDLAQATVLDPGSEWGFDVSSADIGQPTYAAEAPARFEEVNPVDAHARPAMQSASPDARGAEASRAVLDAVVPKVRAQLHDTLEKVAWESFGSITEEIVRQAVDRVEAVAWEVIPQIAETLIQEEIRKMKGEE